MDLHRQPWVTNPSADQGGVEHQCLHKPVPGAAQHPVIVRLPDTTDGVGPGIDENRLPVPVNQQCHRSRQHLRTDLFHLRGGFYLHIRDKTAGKILCPRQILHILTA